MKKFSSFLIAAFLPLYLSALAAPVLAKQVDLRVNLGNPVVHAGKSQTGILKISVKGFDWHMETDRSSVNVALVLDKSGSMGGEKIQHAKEAAIMAIEMLNENDVVSVITYDDTVRVVVPATRLDRKWKIYEEIRNIRSGGRTALFAGVSKGAREVRKYLDRTRVNRVILLSDGLANIGPSSARELGELGASLGREGISVTTIGLGLGYNEDLMTRLAGLSDGNHAFVRDPEDLAQIFRYEFESAMSVVAKDLNIIINCGHGIRPLRVLGREAEIIGQKVRVNLNQISSQQEKFVILEVEIPAGKAGDNRKLASVDVSYLNLQTQRNDALNDSISVKYSGSDEEVKKSVNKPVMESAAEQVVNQMSKDAVRYRDLGQLGLARRELEKGADYLKDNIQHFAKPSPRLERLEDQFRQDAQEMDDADWNAKRKSMKERQFKMDTQQKY